LRGWEWRHLSSRLDDSSDVLRFRPADRIFLLWGPEGLRVGTLTRTGLRFRDESGREFPERPFPRFANWTSIHAGRPATEWLFADWENSRLLRLRDETGIVVCTIKPRKGEASHLALSPDRTRVAVALDSDKGSSIGIYDTSSGEERAACTGARDRVYALAFSPDSRRLAAGGDDHVIHIWDAVTGKQLTQCGGHTSKVLSIAFRQDGSRLVTGAHDGTVRQWDARTGRQVEPPYDRHTAEVFAAVYSPDGQRVASAGADRTVRLWRAKGRHDQAVFRGHTGIVVALAFSQHGRRLVSASHDLPGYEGDGTVRFWEAAPEATLPVLAGHKGYVYPVAYSPDGRWIASGDWDGKVRLWDAATGEPCATLSHPNYVHSLAFLREGPWLVTGSHGDARLRIWDLTTARVLRQIPGPGQKFRSLAVSPDGRRVAAWADGPQPQFRVCDLRSGERLFAAAGRSLAYSPDGRWLAVVWAEEENTVVLLDAQTYEMVARFRGHEKYVHSAAFSPDSRRLASCSQDHTVRLWDVATGRCLRVFEGHTDEVFTAVFHPDGTRIASAGRDRAVRLWDVASGQEVAHLPGHTSYIWSLAFSPDGKTLVSGSGDSTVRLWDTEPLRVRSQARRQAEALRPAAERLVKKLLRQKKNAAAVAAAVRSDRSLSEPERQAAFRAVLRAVTRPRPPGSP
jgi:WD40 repeat protein